MAPKIKVSIGPKVVKSIQRNIGEIIDGRAARSMSIPFDCKKDGDKVEFIDD